MIGLVYKIKCNITNEVYYGSTKQRLKDRVWTHKCPSACRAYLIVKRGDWNIEILETHTDELEMKQREKYYINNFTCINKNNVLRTHEEILEYHRRYREQNKDKVKEYQKRYVEKNKEKIKENYEMNKEKKKLYYQMNKEKILSRQNERKENNKENNKEKQRQYQRQYDEAHKEQKKLYYQMNKERILSRGSEPVECECGGRYVLRHKQKHLRTKKHEAFSLKTIKLKPF